MRGEFNGPHGAEVSPDEALRREDQLGAPSLRDDTVAFSMLLVGLEMRH